MTFEWDEAKNRTNIRKHGFDLADAEEMFRGILLIRPDPREDYGEERWIGVGTIQGRVAFITFAELVSRCCTESRRSSCWPAGRAPGHPRSGRRRFPAGSLHPRPRLPEFRSRPLT